MKKVISILALLAFAPVAHADLLGMAVFVGGTLFGVSQGMAQSGEVKPAPAYLTDACKAQTVKAENANYVYTTYEHCKK